MKSPFDKFNDELFGRLRQVDVLIFTSDAKMEKTIPQSIRKFVKLNIQSAVEIGKKRLESSSWDHLNTAALTCQSFFST